MSQTVEPGSTTLGHAPGERLMLLIGLPVVCLGLGLVVPAIARWILGWAGPLPFRPVFRLVSSVDEPREIALHLGVWVTLGVVLAILALRADDDVTVSDDELTLSNAGRPLRAAKCDIAAIFPDGQVLVVLDRRSRELARRPTRASVKDLKAEFTRRGFPWRDQDPYSSLYRPWSGPSDALPPAVNSLLAVRDSAVREKSSDTVRQLREALQELGYVVQDEGTTQSWRPLVDS